MNQLFILILLFVSILSSFFVGSDNKTKHENVYSEYNLDVETSVESEKDTSLHEDTCNNKSDDFAELSEDEFKNRCSEIIYNDMDDSFIGNYVTKEILFTESEKEIYTCGSTEDFIEEYDEYQHTYRIYEISDKRFDKSFPIQSNDIMRIYGIVTNVSTNYANGLEYPTIDMYYADYIRKWKDFSSSPKTIEEIISERNTIKEKEEKETAYYNALNSDYSGKTKNIPNMESLEIEDFKSHCDSMNFNNMINSNEDLSGRYVKIHIQLSSHKVFTSDEAKKNRLGAIANAYNVSDDVWFSNIFSERCNDYVQTSNIIYFSGDGNFKSENFKKNQELIIYGIVLNYKINDGFLNDFDMFVVYVE